MRSNVNMVDISSKEIIHREAIAEGYIKLSKDTITRILEGKIEKGDVINTAKIAGIMAAKRTYELIPLCHQIPLSYVGIDIEVKEDGILVRSKIVADYKTGVEMEALVAVSMALLTIWDMVKKYEKNENGEYPNTKITEIKILSKIKQSMKL
jgi:cyclic pyranopterin phosphate synthase